MIATSYFIIYVNKKALCLKGLRKRFVIVHYLEGQQDVFFSFLSQPTLSFEHSLFSVVFSSDPQELGPQPPQPA